MKEPDELERLALSNLLGGHVEAAIEHAIEANQIRARMLQAANLRLAAYMRQADHGFEQF